MKKKKTTKINSTSPPKMQEIWTTVNIWCFEWIHFPAIDISVPEVPAEYFITYFSFD